MGGGLSAGTSGGGGYLSQPQQNFALTQGKLPPGLGGGNLSGAQQNYIRGNQGYLPPSLGGPQHVPQPQLTNQIAKYSPQSGTLGDPSGNQYNDFGSLIQQMLGYGGNQGNNLWGAQSGYGNFKLF